MAHPLRGECEIELCGEKFTLRLTLDELESLESMLDEPLYETMKRFAESKQRLRECRHIIRLGFSGAKLLQTPEAIDDMMDADRVNIVSQASKLFMAGLVPSGKESAGDGSNQTPAVTQST